MGARISPLTRSDALRRLAAQAQENRLPQSVLLEGPEGSGKEAAAIELAGLALCGPDGTDANGHRKARLLAHPDLRFAFPVEAAATDALVRELLDEKAREPWGRIRQPSSAVLPIGDTDDPSVCSIRGIRRFVGMKPFEARCRVVIIADAHRMNRQAANALLKTLEEPPETARLLLCTHQPGLLPATIRSRCARVRVPPLQEEELAQHLQAAHALPADEAYRMAAVAGGNARKALDLLDPQARRLAGWASGLLALLAERRLPELLKGAELLAKGQDPTGREGVGKLQDASLSAARDVGSRTLDFLVADLLALSRLQHGGQLSAVQAARLRPLLAALDGRNPAAMAEALLRARDDLGRNVNVALGLTCGLLEAARGGRGRAPGAVAEGAAAAEDSAAGADAWPA